MASEIVVGRTNGEITTRFETVISRGPPGRGGPAGKSAYQVAVDNGFIGTETDWLASLVSDIDEAALTLKANRAGDTFTGPILIPTAVSTDNTTTGANTQWVRAHVANSIDGVNPKNPVRFLVNSATPSLAIDFENGDIYDGLTLVAGDRFLRQVLTGSVSTPDPANGIYVVQASGAAIRGTDADTGAELKNATVMVLAGTYAGTFWVQDNTTPVVGGAPPAGNITFFQRSSSGAVYTAGDLLALDVAEFNVLKAIVAEINAGPTPIDTKAITPLGLAGATAPVRTEMTTSVTLTVPDYSVGHAPGATTSLILATGTIPNPPLIRSKQEPYSIYQFGAGTGGAGVGLSKGEQERAKVASGAEATADFRDVIIAAAASGHLVHWPRGVYPIRAGRIDLRNFDIPINWDIHPAARIKAGVQLHTRLASAGAWTPGEPAVPSVLDPDKIGSVFRFVPSAPVDMNFGDFNPLKIHGGIFDMTELTAAHGNEYSTTAGVKRQINYGLSWLDMNLCSPDLDVMFDCGVRTPGTIALGDSGLGYLDSGINDHGCYGARYRVRGGSSQDVLVYLSGNMETVTLGTDPFTMVNSSPTVTVTTPGILSPLHIGQYVTFSIPGTVNDVVFGITMQTDATHPPFKVVNILSSTQFTVTGTTSATGVTGLGVGGGTGIIMTAQIWDELAQVEGANCYVTGWAYRCNGFVASKRQFMDLTVETVRLLECESGVFGGNVGTAPIGSQGHRFTIRNFHAKRMQGRSLAFYGSRDVFLEDIVVEDFGGYISTNGATQTTVSSDSRIGAIELQSCIQSRIRNVKVRQTDAWKTMVPDAGTTPPVPAAIVLGKSDDYDWATNLTHVQDLVSVDCKIDIVEGAGCDDNVFEDVRTTGNTSATFLSGPHTVVTRFPMTRGVYTQLSDADFTIAAPFPPTIRLTLNAAATRTLTLSSTGAENGLKFKIVRTGTGQWDVKTAAAVLVKSLTANTWCEAEHDGTTWRLTAYGAL
jgi:hypothetical protein